MLVKISSINDKSVGSTVSVRGWVYRHRESKTNIFIIVRDASGIIQCTVKPGSLFEKAKDLFIESSVSVSGIVRKDERAPTGYELDVSALEIIHKGEPFPIQKDKSEEYLLDIRHLWLRSREQNAIMKIKACVLSSARQWLDKNGFIETTPPIIASGAAEGGSTLFEFKYFDSIAYLSQSAQLYQEALIFGLEKVYSITPSFRAEKSRTTRHLAEYWHLEPEAAFVGQEENMKIQEDLVSHICKNVAKMKELAILERKPAALKAVKPPFKRIDYAEAVEILKAGGFDAKWGDDFGTKEEAFLSQKEKRPIFVTNFPLAIKAFYMKENPADPRTVLAADMLAPEGYGELIGGSERETDYNKLVARLKAQGDKIENYAWYLDLRKYGSVQHSGFGMGVERLIRWVCKLEHIRDAIPFPRVINRAYP